MDTWFKSEKKLIPQAMKLALDNMIYIKSNKVIIKDEYINEKTLFTMDIN